MVDHQRHVDIFVAGIDLGHRVDLNESKALVRIHVGQRGDVFAQAAAAKNLPGGELDSISTSFPVVDQFAADLDFADPILRPFFNAKDNFQTRHVPAKSAGIIDLVFDVAMIIVVIGEDRDIVRQHVAIEHATIRYE